MHPRQRELDRDELFDKARGEVLDEIVNLSLVSPKTWEDAITEKIWQNMNSYVFEKVYLPAAQSENSGACTCYVFYGLFYRILSSFMVYFTRSICPPHYESKRTKSGQNYFSPELFGIFKICFFFTCKNMKRRTRITNHIFKIFIFSI